MMKILVYLPAVAKCVGGGVAIQAEMTISELEQRGMPIIRYSPWNEYNWDEIAAVHIFRADYETHNFAQLVCSKNIPLIVSPVFFSSHSSGKIKALTTLTGFARKFISGIRSDFDYVKECTESAELILPNTSEEKNLLVKSFDLPEEKFIVIPNGVAERFSAGSPVLFCKKYGVDQIMLSVANLGYRRKNMLAAIQAAAQTDIPYFIIGPKYDNSYGNQCLEAIDKAENINYLGYLDNDDPLLASAYAAAKLFLLPSLFETPGIASMEAALAGAEIVTTPFGGPKEYFENDATYALPHSVQSIRDAINTAWTGPQKSPGNRIKKLYTWNKIADLMEPIYRRYL